MRESEGVWDNRGGPAATGNVASMRFSASAIGQPRAGPQKFIISQSLRALADTGRKSRRLRNWQPVVRSATRWVRSVRPRVRR